jgi:hypothetical protein
MKQTEGKTELSAGLEIKVSEFESFKLNDASSILNQVAIMVEIKETFEESQIHE